MKRSIFAVCTVIIALLVQRDALAQLAEAKPYRQSPVANSLSDVAGLMAGAGGGTNIIRVTDSRDGQSARVPDSSASSLNLNSTRFYIIVDGVATLYSFDPAKLKAQNQGPLFEALSLEADGCNWSATDPDTIFGLLDAPGLIQIYSYNVQTRSYAVVKDLSGLMGGGEASRLIKAASDDNRFAFSWRESELSPWHYVVVWDRASDSTYIFDITDLKDGVPGYSYSYLDRAGAALVVKGDVTRVWRYQAQAQSEAASETAEPGPKKISRDGRFMIYDSGPEGMASEVFIAAATEAAAASETVIWTNTVNCTAIQNSLQKTGGAHRSDDASATSLQSIESGEGYVEFTASEADKERFCGISNANGIHQVADDINFAIKLSSKRKAIVCENGDMRLKVKYKPGTIFRIAVVAGAVLYYKGGELIHTSTLLPTYPLIVTASLVDGNSMISNAMISGGKVSVVVSISPTKTILSAGQSTQFNAVVTGGATNRSVVWSANQGTISTTGLYTAPGLPGNYTIRATSAADPRVSATALAIVTGESADIVPPVINGVASSGVSTSGSTISWNTNEASTTQVEYGTNLTYGSATTPDPALVTSHSAALSGLTPNTLYHYRVKSRDVAGNLATSGDFTFTTTATAPTDTMPPVISGVSASGVTAGGATINWTTNEASNTQVEFGTSTTYGSSTTLNSSMVTSHNVPLSGLLPSTLYHYRVKSRDGAGNLATSGNFTFTTSGSGGGPGIKTDYGIYQEPPLPALPAAGGTFMDPTFGTTIMRVTDERDGGNAGVYYSYWPTLNVNSTRLQVMIDGTPYQYQLDPDSFRLLNKRPLWGISLPTGGHPFAEDAIWSGTDPDSIYAHAGMKLWKYNLATNTWTLIKDFGGQLPAGDLWQMSKSLDDNVFAFTRRDQNYRFAGYLAWRRDTNTLYAQDTTNVNEVQIDKTGRYLVVKTDTVANGQVFIKIVDLQTSRVENLVDGPPDFAPGHSDNGNGTLIGGDRYNNRTLIRRLDNPHQVTSIQSLGSDWSQAGHNSMLADDEGWTLISAFVHNFSAPRGPFHGEVWQVATDGSGRVRRLVHHRSIYRQYTDAPRANISRDGRFVSFSSNWGGRGRTDVFIVKITGGVTPGPTDTQPPVISGVSATGVSSAGATINWATNESSTSQVEYGTTTSYGNSTTLDAGMVTSHSAALTGLAANTLYHYRVKSRDGAGNLATSGNFTFTTSAAGTGGGGGGGGAGRQEVVWINLVECVATGNSLRRNVEVAANAGASSQQQITSGSGYVEFTASETNTIRFVGLASSYRGPGFEDMKFSIKLTNAGTAEVRELNVYRGDVSYRVGDVFRISVESGIVRYYKNGTAFRNSNLAPTYPLIVKATLLSLNSTLNNVFISGASSGISSLAAPASINYIIGSAEPLDRVLLREMISGARRRREALYPSA